MKNDFYENYRFWNKQDEGCSSGGDLRRRGTRHHQTKSRMKKNEKQEDKNNPDDTDDDNENLLSICLLIFLKTDKNLVTYFMDEAIKIIHKSYMGR